MVVLTYIGYFLVFVGAIFLFLGAVGILRMPDLYTRIQAGTKASTLGSMSLILGVGFLQPEWMIKTIIIVIFIGLSNPLSSHALARGSHKSGLIPFSKEDIDAYQKETKTEEVTKWV